MLATQCPPNRCHLNETMNTFGDTLTYLTLPYLDSMFLFGTRHDVIRREGEKENDLQSIVSLSGSPQPELGQDKGRSQELLPVSHMGAGAFLLSQVY